MRTFKVWKGRCRRWIWLECFQHGRDAADLWYLTWPDLTPPLSSCRRQCSLCLIRRIQRAGGLFNTNCVSLTLPLERISPQQWNVNVISILLYFIWKSGKPWQLTPSRVNPSHRDRAGWTANKTISDIYSKTIDMCYEYISVIFTYYFYNRRHANSLTLISDGLWILDSARLHSLSSRTLPNICKRRSWGNLPFHW